MDAVVRLKKPRPVRRSKRGARPRARPAFFLKGVSTDRESRKQAHHKLRGLEEAAGAVVHAVLLLARHVVAWGQHSGVADEAQGAKKARVKQRLRYKRRRQPGGWRGRPHIFGRAQPQPSAMRRMAGSGACRQLKRLAQFLTFLMFFFFNAGAPGLPMHLAQHSSVRRDIVCCSCALACCCTRKFCARGGGGEGTAAEAVSRQGGVSGGSNVRREEAGQQAPWQLPGSLKPVLRAHLHLWAGWLLLRRHFGCRLLGRGACRAVDQGLLCCCRQAGGCNSRGVR